MTPHYRLIAVDLDGTLLDDDGVVPQPNRAALDRARRAGIAVCICTGRSHLESRPVAGDAIAWFARRGLPTVVTHDGYTAGFHCYVITRGASQAGMGELRRWTSRAVCAHREVCDWPTDAPAAVRVGIIVPRPDAYPLEAEFRRNFAGRLAGQALYVPNADLWVLEFFAPDVNKWTGLLPIADERGIAPAQIVAIGDDVNDIAMIEKAGLGIAMANAHEAVKQVADRIAPSNDEAGVATVINEILDGVK